MMANGAANGKTITIRLSDTDFKKYNKHLKQFGYQNLSTLVRRGLYILYEYDTNPLNKMFNAVGEQYWHRKYGK